MYLYKSKKGQVGLEYMSIIAFTTLLIIVIIGLSYTYSKDVNEQVSLNQVEGVIKRMVESSESIYYFGEPSRVELNVFFPKSVEGITIGNKEIVFSVRTQAGLTDVFRKSSVELNGSLPTTTGYHNIMIESKGSYVWINSS